MGVEDAWVVSYKDNKRVPIQTALSNWELKNKELSYNIIGRAMEIHSILENGLLINFGAKSLQYIRLLNKKYNPDSP